jgi:putative FmdB family regulatory protein
MPTYEFRCPEGHDFEKFYRKISDAEAVVWCPTCGEIAQRRLSAGAGLLFKGSGFYITDYGKDGKKDLKPAAKGGEGSNSGGESASSESTSGESKPAESKPATAKAESKPAGKPEGKPENKPAPKASGSAE